MSRLATVTGDAAIAESANLHAGATATGEYHCRDCGYGITVRTELPWCPMCGGYSWEDASSPPVSEKKTEPI